MKMWKRCLIIAMVLCLLGFCAVPVQAEDNMQMADQAGLLSEQEAEEINSWLAELEERIGWDLMAMTTDEIFQVCWIFTMIED